MLLATVAVLQQCSFISEDALTVAVKQQWRCCDISSAAAAVVLRQRQCCDSASGGAVTDSRGAATVAVL